MERYEVCAVKVSSNMIMIYTYESEENFELDRPTAVYIIPREHPSFPPEDEFERRHGDVIEVIENEDRAIEIYNDCKRAPKFIVIPVL